MFTVADAYALAQEAHAGQVDKMGDDYYTAHLVPIAEALQPYGPYAEMAGVLHDIVEDTREHPQPYTAERLLDLGVPAEVVEAVVAVSRNPGEDYMDMIRRAAEKWLSRVVKLADNKKNGDGNAELAKVYPELARRLKRRYDKARAYLLAAEEAEAAA